MEANCSVTDNVAITEIILCGEDTNTKAANTKNLDFSIFNKINQALRSTSRSRDFVLGNQLPGKHRIQVTSDLDAKWCTGRVAEGSFVDTVQRAMPGRHCVIHAMLNRPALGPHGPATAKVVEYAMTSFAISQVTSDFKAAVEADFLEFDRIFSKGAKGNIGLSYGWVLEEREHPAIIDEKVACFLVVRGWESLVHFHQSTDSDTFREALPILLAWKAPYQMVNLPLCDINYPDADYTKWHIERMI